MLALAFLFLILALVCYVFGAGVIGDVALTVAKLFLVLFVLLLLLSIFGGMFAPGPYWYWPRW
jgi:uncharacterized membrane protein YtjA (UPF0391 family)